ncbi:hypothetical protein Salat_2674800 [Sesamum alatum]|uniref:Uncharacterized protein n=1 Tax=Sesamum alatum TaxID=300844 RepID=A0AAE1XPJ1_9LAMI|nr:hypothetical protein Salat_2674800 [Sesamum alatum]
MGAIAVALSEGGDGGKEGQSPPCGRPLSASPPSAKSPTVAQLGNRHRPNPDDSKRLPGDHRRISVEIEDDGFSDSIKPEDNGVNLEYDDAENRRDVVRDVDVRDALVDSESASNEDMRVYQAAIMPVNGPKLWAQTRHISPLPPNFGRKSGRPSRARRMEQDGGNDQTEWKGG